jgi:acyl carrier protein
MVAFKKTKKESENNNMFEKIKELIVEEIGVEADQVTLEASFKDDLEVDSLDLFEMVMTLEEEFDVEIPSEDLEQINTVGDLVKYLENK